MSTINDEDIEALLDRWSKSKISMLELEKKVEKYKKLANRVMDTQGTHSISSPHHTLKRRTMSRKTISKHDVPEHVWEKYARTCSYPAYYLTENK